MKKRPDGRWQKRITLPSGKSKLLYSSAKTEKAAIQDFNSQMLNLRRESEDSLLFEAVAERWMDSNRKIQSNTAKGYKPCYDAAVAYFSGWKISEIKPAHVLAYLDDLEEKGYSKKTVKNRLSVLRLIFRHAKINQDIEYSPCSDVSLPKNLSSTKRQSASKEDEQKICASTDSLIGILAYTYLTTGCRRGEALALTPQDIDIENKTLSINKTVEWINSAPRIKPSPKTEAGIRTIPITDKLIALLSPFMTQEYIFLNEKGKLFGDSHITKMWNRYKKQIGISCTPHELRHSYATILFDAGIDVKTAQVWLGHADINTTLNIYTHLSDRKREESARKLSDYFLTTFYS
ncbi:MAG: tyrosine-type recombinase/integrase [Oscillospiraceae bacterium]|nr:tyrosine-type recombinase/integrase [Oscillospiraceae bacterium]MBQ7120146.1 tyrosine-type recombinase/integrase [Oscillospiraceae bacterium]